MSSRRRTRLPYPRFTAKGPGDVPGPFALRENESVRSAGLERGVGSVTKGRSLGAFAGTPGDGLFLFDDHFLRSKLSPGMRTVTEGLLAGLSARAPVIGAGLNFFDDGKFLWDVRFAHDKAFLFLFSGFALLG